MPLVAEECLSHRCNSPAFLLLAFSLGGSGVLAHIISLANPHLSPFLCCSHSTKAHCYQRNPRCE
ncbi:hypothetical protein B0H12DRAFT_1108961, partial [Mycena haematopus]